ncbi:MAG: helicase, partial [Deltaproteobacteria bacterium]
MVAGIVPVDLQPLFVAIRAACSPRTWSQGIELVRADAVDGVEADDDEIVLRVRTPGRTVAPLSTLYPADAEWDCDCGSAADACEHVAAAVISLRQARKAGQALPSSATAAASVGYRLAVDGDRLAVARVLVAADGAERPLEGSIGSLLAAGGPDAAVEPREVDLRIDRLLTMRRVRALSGEGLAPLLALLAEATDLRLDGKGITASGEPVKPRAVVVEPAAGKGLLLRIERNEIIEQVVVPGIALCRSDGDLAVLRPLGETALTGLALDRLPVERSFGPGAMAELVAEVLPELEQRVELEIQTDKLPQGVSKQPLRPLVEVSQRGPALSLLGAVVYGDPPCARVAGDQLVHLGGPIPKRDRRGEQRVAAQLLAELDLLVGKRVALTGQDAVEMAARLRGYHGLVAGDVHRTSYPQQPLAVELVPSTRHFDLLFTAAGSDGETHRADPSEVLKAWRDGAEVVPLLSGGWGRLPADWLQRYGHQVADLLLARDADGELAAHAQPALAQLCDDLNCPRPPDLQRLAPLVDGFQSIPRAALPAGLQAELRDYQRGGVDWLSFLREARLGAVLADDMGLGKTLQTLCALKGRALVVCPTSVVHNWVAEIARFLPSLRHSIYHGARRELDEQAEVTLTTYALLRNDVTVLS